MVAPAIIKRVVNFIKRGPRTPTAYEQEKNMSIAGNAYQRAGGVKFAAKKIFGMSRGEQALATALSGATPVGAGATAVGQLGKGASKVAQLLFPSFNPGVVATRGLATAAAIEAYNVGQALGQDSSNPADYLPSAEQLGYSVASGIFPPAAAVGFLAGGGEKKVGQAVTKAKDFIQGFNTPDIPNLPNVPATSIIYDAPEISYQFIQPETSSAAAMPTAAYAPSLSVDVGGGMGGGSDEIMKLLLLALFGGGVAGFALGRKKRKKYKRKKSKKKHG